MTYQIYTLALILTLSFADVDSQESDPIAQVVYLIGNTAKTGKDGAKLNALREQISRERHPYVLIHLGDIISMENRAKPEGDLDRFFDLVEGHAHGQLLFTAGDMDWNNSQRDGLTMVRKLEKQVEDRAEGQRVSGNVFLPSDGCPGPEIMDLSPQLRLIFHIGGYIPLM